MEPTIGRIVNVSTPQVVLIPQRKPVYKFCDVEVFVPDLRVTVGGKPVHFSLMELRLLMIFLESPFEVISSAELVRRLDLTSTNSLHNLICLVRALLDQKYIHSHRGYGFCFAR